MATKIKSKKINLIYPAIIIAFLLVLLIIGILLSLILSSIFGKFSLTLLKIAFANSLFLSIGMIFNMIIARLLILKINNIIIFLLSFLIILGTSFIGFIYILYKEPFFFLYETNLVYSYLLINFLFIISISIITTGFLIFQISLSAKEKKIIEEKNLREQIEQKLYISRINPHFLFNSLNLIISLLKKPKIAEKSLLYLSELLRYNLDAANKDFIPIEEELKYVERYLFIQKLRFEGRLSYNIICRDFCDIPPLLIQPLVENCIKHNINESSLLEISIDAFLKNKIFYIKILTPTEN